MSDQIWFPWQLGGTGYFRVSFSDLPYPKEIPGLQMYSLVTMGYHVGGLITHLMGPRKNDFAEMALHHIVAFYMYAGYYLSNHLNGGSVAAMLHDFADIGISLSKVVSETRYTKSAVAVFLTTMGVWAYTRMIVLPFFIYDIYLYCPQFEPGWMIKPIFIYLISCMCMLHFYWFGLFVKMVTNYKNKGVAEDL